MRLEYQILAALLLDLLLGDPRRLPHPVRLIGALALRLEAVCRKIFSPPRLAGMVTVAGVLLIVGLAAYALLHLAARLHPLAGEATSVLLLYTTIAARDLTRHGSDVFQALENEDIAEARRRVALIVGRDTANLDEAGIAKATVESVAESMVDGVTAPLFFAVLGGPLGAMLYKAVNTLDSTFGYKNDRYVHFGWAAARLDDLANFLPARLTALMVAPAAALLRLDSKNAWRIFRRDRFNHPSPNSGHSEAAMAGALGVQLGGPASYFGKPVAKPFMGEPLQPIRRCHIQAAIRLMLVASAFTLALFLGLRLLALFIPPFWAAGLQ